MHRCQRVLNASLCPAGLQLPLDDGSWHLLGVTTRPEGGDGFQLYVDGALAGEVGPGVLYPGALPLCALCSTGVRLASGHADVAVGMAASCGRQPHRPLPAASYSPCPARLLHPLGPQTWRGSPRLPPGEGP